MQVAEEADWVCSMHPFSSMRSCAVPEDTTIVKAFASEFLLFVTAVSKDIAVVKAFARGLSALSLVCLKTTPLSDPL